MVNSCYLCGRKASRADNISLHSFPKKLDVRRKWLDACGLSVNDDVRRTCICSRHFKAEDICHSNIFGTVKSSIKRNAVPTLYLTNPLNIDTSYESPPNTPSELFNENEVANQSSSYFPDSNIVDDNSVLDILEKSKKKCPEKFFKLNTIEVQRSNQSSINSNGSYDQSDLNQCMENTNSTFSIKDENTVPDENILPSRCQKRKFFEPRYVSEISQIDFATPKRAKRTLDLIKKTDQKKSERIKQLQRQARNLKKKVKSLKDVINHLKQNRMLTDESGDALMNALPSDWKYKLLKKVVFGSPSKLEVCIKVALFSPSEIQAWVEALEEKVQCSYSINTTRKCAGEKVLFKRRLSCQHRTRNKSSYPDLKTGTRNTNCPSRLSISLMRIQKKFRGKDPPDPQMPCIIDYVITHNHPSTLSVRYRRVNKSVQEKLKELFSVGYNASTAYEYVKVELQINNPLNYEELFVNRSICPDRNFCHRWYNLYLKEHGSIDSADKTFLIKRIEEYNTKMGEECANIEIDQESFIVVLCPPLFKRVHQYIKGSSEIVYMASINPADNDGSKAFFMSTHSACSELPLGIIITSLETSDLITRGLKILQSMVGDTIFYGNKKGPKLFVVDDCEAGKISLNTIWPQSEVLFCMFHILNSLWRYLLCTKNGISREEALTFFKQFRQIMVAPTKEICNQMFSEALELADRYNNYLQVLEAYWQRKDMWTIAYRNVDLHHQFKYILSLDDSNTSFCLLKESIFHRMRSLNVIQLFDFLSTKFVDYYKGRLLDGANDRLIRNMSRKIPIKIDTQKIQKINKYLYFVPSLNASNTYAVNTEILACTCLKNNTGYICFHIGWLLAMSPSFQENIEDPELREIFYLTATGKKVSVKPEYETSVINLNYDVEYQQEQQDEIMPEKSRIIEQVILVGNEVLKLEIVQDDEDENRNRDSETESLITDREQVILEGKNIINELSSTLNYLLEQSPYKVVPALQKLLIQTNSNSSSVDNFVLGCETYAGIQ